MFLFPGAFARPPLLHCVAFDLCNLKSFANCQPYLGKRGIIFLRNHIEIYGDCPSPGLIAGLYWASLLKGRCFRTFESLHWLQMAAGCFQSSVFSPGYPMKTTAAGGKSRSTDCKLYHWMDRGNWMKQTWPKGVKQGIFRPEVTKPSDTIADVMIPRRTQSFGMGKPCSNNLNHLHHSAFWGFHGW